VLTSLIPAAVTLALASDIVILSVGNSLVLEHEGIDEEVVPAYFIDLSPEEVAAFRIKLEEMFNCPSNENASEDGMSY
jgi:hypothetical protein